MAEAARNVAVTGARPLAVTNCLNFGSPEQPERMWEFAEAVRGMGDACRALGLPIDRRQRQLLQRDGGGGRDPADADDRPGRPARRRAPRRARRASAAAGDDVIFLGETRAELGGSEYLAVRHGLERGAPPLLDLAAEKRLHAAARASSRRAGSSRSAHDCSDGGAAIALAECAIRAGIGVEAELPGAGLRPDVAPLRRVRRPRDRQLRARRRPTALLARARELGVPAARIGRTGGARLRISPGVDVSVAEAHDAWARTLPEALG